MDEDDFLDSTPIKPSTSRSAAQPKESDAQRTVTPYQQPAELQMFDSTGREDPALWISRCPKRAQSDASCLIQRAGTRTLPVLDVDCVIPLRVPQYRCRQHGQNVDTNDFLATSPSIFQQLCNHGVMMMPRIVCLTACVVITRGAYECVSSCRHGCAVLHA